jgi:hypothetical protein
MSGVRVCNAAEWYGLSQVNRDLTVVTQQIERAYVRLEELQATRAKIMESLGLDSTKIYPVDGETQTIFLTKGEQI